MLAQAGAGGFLIAVPADLFLNLFPNFVILFLITISNALIRVAVIVFDLIVSYVLTYSLKCIFRWYGSVH